MNRLNKPQNKEQNYFKKLNRQNLPLFQINNTPLRTRDNSQHENVHHNGQKYQQMQKQSKSMFQNDMSNQSKTAIKKKNTNSVTCSNHPEVPADYRIQIDNQYLGYCNKCAAYLASNGFSIEKIATSRASFQNKDKQSPFIKRKHELNNFLSSLQQLQKNYIQKEQQIKKVKTSYEIQQETIANFYASMLEYVQYIKIQHLNFIQEESQRFQQISEVQYAEIQETLEEIQVMKEDIEHNMDKIVEQVEEDSYIECMTYYNQQKDNIDYRLQELKVQNSGTKTQPQIVNSKLQEFKVFMQQLTGINCSKYQEEEYV